MYSSSTTTTLLLLVVVLLTWISSSSASHFRGGYLNWERTGTGSDRTVLFYYTTAWVPGLSSCQPLTINGVGTVPITCDPIVSYPGYDLIRGKGTFVLPADGPYTVTWSGCCRASGFENIGESSWFLRTVVDLGSDNRYSPKSLIDLVLPVPVSTAWTFQLPVVDADGQQVTCAYTDPSVTSAGTLPNIPISYNSQNLTVSSDCTLSWNTPSVAAKFVTSIDLISTAGTSQGLIQFDFIIETVTGGVPPVCEDHPEQTIYAGELFSTTFHVSDADVNDQLKYYLLSNLPSGATLTPAAGGATIASGTPTTGPQADITFQWTPAGEMSYLLVLSVRDKLGLATQCSQKLTVLLKPTDQSSTGTSGLAAQGWTSVTSNATVQIVSNQIQTCDGSLATSQLGGSGNLQFSLQNDPNSQIEMNLNNPHGTTYGTLNSKFLLDFEWMKDAVDVACPRLMITLYNSAVQSQLEFSWIYDVYENDNTCTGQVNTWNTQKINWFTGKWTLSGDMNGTSSRTLSDWKNTNTLLSATASNGTLSSLNPSLFLVNPDLMGITFQILQSNTPQSTPQAYNVLVSSLFLRTDKTAANGMNAMYTFNCAAGECPVAPPTFDMASLNVSSTNAVVDKFIAYDAITNQPIDRITCETSEGVIIDTWPYTFPFTTTTGTCHAIDSAGNCGSAPFQVTVLDVLPPSVIVTIPCDMNAEDANGASVAYHVEVVDNDKYHTLVATCQPPSGHYFPMGITAVSCHATDASGNESPLVEFNVTVADIMAPTLRLPSSPVTVEATSESSTVVDYVVSAKDNVDEAATIPITCTPSSGSVFSLGITMVQCYASDATGNVSPVESFFVHVRDTTAPSLQLPATIVMAVDPIAVPVPYNVTVSDAVDATPTLVCVPPSGSVFGVGEHTVTCSVTDDYGNTAQGQFYVTISTLDLEPPHITVRILDDDINAVNSDGAIVHYDEWITVTDDVDTLDTISLECVPPSGSVFPMGVTIVNCTAMDSAGNVSPVTSFEVTVEDYDPPNLIVPHQSMTVEATSHSHTVVTFSPSVQDAVDSEDSLTVTCIPSSGSEFAMGGTEVQCYAADTSGNQSPTRYFLVHVRDTTPPILDLPQENITVDIVDKTSTAIHFSVNATDAVDSDPVVFCTPASGSEFPEGTHLVNCTAMDSYGNRQSGHFYVTVNALRRTQSEDMGFAQNDASNATPVMKRKGAVLGLSLGLGLLVGVIVFAVVALLALRKMQKKKEKKDVEMAEKRQQFGASTSNAPSQ